MTTISLADWHQSPEIVVGEAECRVLTIAALTEVADRGNHTDFLLYELDRARVVPDALLPPDVVRLGSVVRYEAEPGGERIVKLALPEDTEPGGGYRLSVTSSHGAALLGLVPGASMTWLGPDGATNRIRVVNVSNPRHPGDA